MYALPLLLNDKRFARRLTNYPFCYAKCELRISRDLSFNIHQSEQKFTFWFTK